MSIKKLFISILFVLFYTFGFSEGTREISPDENNQTYFTLRDQNSYSNFARYNSLESERLNFTICNPGEKVFWGLQKRESSDMKFRIRRASDGAVVFNERDVPTSGEGYISSYNRAVAGPNEIAGTTNGYNAYELTGLATGDYYIEFDTDDDNINFRYLDITVASSANVALPGRLWSKEWLMDTRGFNNPFEGKMYVYADDGIVTSIDFNGISPYVFNISANATGVKTTGNFNEDRQSVGGRQTYPQYKVFLNPPDEDCFPSGQFGKVTGGITVTGCGLDKCINVPVDQAGRVLVLLDLNGTPGYQPNSADVQFNVFVEIGNNCIPWDTRDNFGNIIPEGQDIDMQIDYLNGITHLPLYDVENHPEGYTVELVRPLDPDVPDKPRLFWDDVNLTSQAGGQVPTTELTGCLDPNGCHDWLAAPNFNNGSQDYGNRSTVNTWWYANIITEITGYVVQNAIVDADTRITGTGDDNDTTICSNSGAFILSGGLSFAPSGTWSTSGDGEFSDVKDLNGTYTPSVDDFINGSVVLTLESDSTNDCPRDEDYLTLNLDPGPTITLGPGDTLCENNSNVTLNGTFQDADGIVWIGGRGTFVPNRNNPNATYNPHPEEIDSGSVEIIYSTDNTTNICPNESDTVVFFFQQSPIISLDALSDTVCSSTTGIQLTGSVANAGGGTWIGGNGTFSPSRDSINTTYTPTQAEKNSGSLTLTLSSRLETNGCNPVTEDITFTFFTPTAVSITAPTIQTCATADTVYLTSNLTGNPTIQWSGGNGSFFPSNTSNTPKYVVTADDITAGTITLSVTTDGRDGCSLVTDDVDVVFSTPPTVSVNSTNETVCANNPTVDLGGNFSNASGVTWVGNGGSFSPHEDSLNVTYTPSQAEIDMVPPLTTVFLTTRGSGFCQPETAPVNIIIAPSPIVEANGPYTICSNNPTIEVSGSSQNSNSTAWTSPELNQFDDSTAFTTNFTASATQIATQNPITLTLNANQSSPVCNTVSDNATVTFDPLPTVEAGPAISICENNATAQLNGSFSNTNGVTWSGGENNVSNVNDPIGTYTPSANEIAAGNVTLFLTTNGGIGACNNVSDSVVITITPAPIVDAGLPQSVCRNNPRVTFTGTVQNATGGIWSGGERNVAPSTSRLTNARYNPTNNERNNGSVTLTLTSTGNGNCNAVSDDLVIEITDRARVTNFTNNTVCADDPAVSYLPSLTVATGGFWSGGNGTYTPNDSTLNMTYTPSQDEINNGSARLTLTTTNNGNCNEVSFSRNINIDPAPIVNAGSDQTICGSENAVQLNGFTENVTGGRWTSLGTSNTFSNRNELAATFTPSAQDKLDGEVELVLTTRGNGRCNAISDTMKITFSEVPVAEAGNGRNLCTTEFPIQLNASGSSGNWIGGVGTFSPDRNTLNATYEPTTGEVGTGDVTLTWQTNINGSCPQVSDNVTYTLQEGATITTSGDQTVCGSTSTIDISSTITNAGNTFWTTNGAGDINPNPTNEVISYTPSIADTSLTDTTSITFYAATIDNLGCPPATDSIVITFAPATVILANSNQTLCADGSNITLNGSAINTSAVLWTGGNGGSFNPATQAATSYTPNATDLAQTTLTFILTSTPTTACLAVTDTTVITLEQGPTTTIGPDRIICGDSSFIDLTATTTGATVGLWTSTGTGSFSPTETDLTTQYYPSDADTALSQVTIYFTTQGSGICQDITDSLILDITDAPILFAGNNDTLCSDSDPITLNGVDNGIAGSLTWSSSGNGTFSDVNNPNSTYEFSADDISNTIVALTLSSNGSGNCNETSHTFNILLTPLPTISAGLPQIICVIDDSVSLNATVTNATGVVWSTPSNGSFSADSTLNTTYALTSQDTAAKSITLVATTTGTGLCKSYADSVDITLQVLPIIDAGNDLEVCGDTRTIPLSGTVTDAGGVEWTSSGTGLFSPNTTAINTNYSVTDNDTTNGSIRMFLETTASGVCPDQIDSLDITITDVPQVFAGSDTTVCANIDSIQIGGSISIATGGKWLSSGNGTFSPNDSTFNAYYLPSTSDTAAGQVTITLQSTGNGLCNPVSNDYVINFTPAPFVNAGANMTICADSSGVQLRPTLRNVTSLVWRTSGTGVFGVDSTVFTPSYFPSTQDTSSGQVTLTVIANGGEQCNAVTSSTVLNITPQPTLELSEDQTICFEANSVDLSAIISNTNGGQWTSNSTGNFSPSSFNNNVQFFPNTTDTAISITFVTEANGVCSPITDSLKIFILPQPTVNAGDNSIFCADIEQFRLDGSVTNAIGGVWSTSGEGAILPNDSSLFADYGPVDEDRLQDSIVFSLTTYDTLGCTGASDQRVVYFTPIPIINAGTNINTCPGIASIPLNGTVTNAGGGRWEDLNGNGTFSDSLNLATTYFPDPASSIDGNSVTIRLETTGNGKCNSYEEEIIISFTNSFSINAGGPSMEICDTDFPIQLNGTGAQGEWSGGLGGTFEPNAQAMDATYIPSTADSLNRSVTLTLTTINVGSCTPATDNVTIDFIDGPQVDAGSDIIICTNENQIILSGSRINSDTTVWTTSGKGSFDNITRLDPIYTISDKDKSVGFVNFTLVSIDNGTCNQPKDAFKVTLKPGPIVNPGSGFTLCANATEIQLDGSVTNATGGSWSGGSGGFLSSSSVLNARYQIQPADTTNGSVTLTLTTNGHPDCNPESSNITFNFDKLATADAGTPQTICANIDSIQLTGRSQNASSRYWNVTGGDGFFSPKAQQDTVTYILGTNDVTLPTLEFTYNAETNNNCPATSSNLTLTIDPAPTVNAGSVIEECENTPSIILNGAATNTSSVEWISTGTGSFTPDSITLGATYIPDSLDIIKGAVNIELKATDPNCNPVSDFTTINFVDLPTSSVNAGVDIEICADITEIPLQGSISSARIGKWSTSGNGEFLPNDSTLNATYIPTANDTTNGLIYIRLTAEGNTDCGNITDSISITFTDIPTANVNSNVTVCEDTTSIPLEVNLEIATGIKWSTGGTGTFSPNRFDTLANYIPSQTDINNGTIVLSLETTGNGTCQSISETVAITITKAPTIVAGLPQTICESTPSIAITGTTTIANNGIWSTSGSGDFGLETNKNTTYEPSANDAQNGLVILTFTTTDHGQCKPVNDQVSITFVEKPTINIGNNIRICEDESTVSISASGQNLISSEWSTLGSGSFNSSSSMSTTYTLSPTDLNSSSVDLVFTGKGNNVCPDTSATLQLQLVDAPTVTATAGVLCNLSLGSDITGTITQAQGGLWSTDGTGSFSANDRTLIGKYFPSLTDANSSEINLTITTTGNGLCQPVSADAIIEIEPIPIANAGNDITTCRGSDVTISAEIEDGINYEWQLMDGTVIGNSSKLTVTATNDISYILVASRDDGCNSTDQINVFVYDLPTIQLDTQYCFTDTLMITATVTNMPSVPGSFQWYRDGVILQNEVSTDHIVRNTGDYTVQFSYGNCSEGTSTIITPLPELESEDEIGCRLSTTQVQTTTINGANYTWSSNNSTVGNGNPVDVPTPTDSAYFTVSVTDNLGCLKEDSLKVIGVDRPVIQLTDVIACDNDTVLLDATPTNLNSFTDYTLVYSWFKDNISLNINDTTRLIKSESTGTYKSNVSIGQCIGSDSAIISINISPTPILPDEVKFCVYTNETLILNPGPGRDFLWSTGDTTRLILISDTGEYSVTVTNEFDCSANDTVNAKELCKPELFVPTGFVPGSDGLDNFFEVFGHHFQNFKMTIYNRWGEVIYYTEDPKTPWDGYYLGELMPIGVYAWKIEYQGFDIYDEVKLLEGSVTVVR